MPQYGEPTEPPIIFAIVCRALQLCVCTVECTNRCANNHITSNLRDLHAAVRTGRIVGSYLRSPKRKVFTIFQRLRAISKPPKPFLKSFKALRAHLRDHKFIICAARRATEAPGSTRSRRDILAYSSYGGVNRDGGKQRKTHISSRGKI